MFSRSFSVFVLAVSVAAVFAATAVAADQTVTGNQFVVGKACIGLTCNDTVVPAEELVMQATDTPTIRFDQAGGAFSPYVWDVAGNEANFFVRDLTAGSRLPFRIRPGAATSMLDVGDDAGYVTSVGQFALQSDKALGAAAFDTTGTLDKLANVGFQTYTTTGSTNSHFRPNPADLNTQFAQNADVVNPTDIASLALAGAKENNTGLKALIARVDAIAGTEVTPLSTSVAKLKKENAKLKKDYKALAKSLKSLKAQVRKLARSR